MIFSNNLHKFQCAFVESKLKNAQLTYWINLPTTIHLSTDTSHQFKSQMPTALALSDFTVQRCVHWGVERPWFVFSGEAVCSINFFYKLQLCKGTVLDTMAQNIPPI